MDNADEVLRTYLQLPETAASWLYLHPERIRSAFVEQVGSVERFSISSSRVRGGSGEVKLVVAGASVSGEGGQIVDVSYKVDDPLVMSLLVQARVAELGIYSGLCEAGIGDLVRFIAPGCMTHPELGDTTKRLSEFYSPVVAEAVEAWRSARERDAQFVNEDAKCVAVAFETSDCDVMSVLSKDLIRNDWPTRYNRGQGSLGVLGHVEDISDGLTVIAPLHIWWQPVSEGTANPS